MTEIIIDTTEPTEEWEVPTGQRTRFVLDRNHGFLLEVEDLHFHFDSAILMPDIETHGRAAPQGREGLSGLAVLRACLLHADAHPDQKLLILGHADSVGREAYNLKLSELRAENVLHALTGDRDAWVDIARKKNTTLDVEQMLAWLASTWGWACAPGKVDGLEDEVTRAAIESFQAQYNHAFDKSIAVDGIIGKQTFGAFFDLYERELAFMLETDAEGLATYRGKLKFLGPKAIGCGEHHPISGLTTGAHRSAVDRRVEIVFFDPGEEPALSCHSGKGACAAEKCELYRRGAYRFERIEVEPAAKLVWLDLQTSDELGVSAPNTALVLHPEVGESIDIETDDKGYWTGRVRAGGKIRVTLPDGTPLRFGASQSGEQPSGGAEDTVVLTVRVSGRTTTDIVVPGAAQDVVDERRDLVQRYGRTPVAGRHTARSGATGQREGEPVGPAGKRGKANKYTRRTSGTRVADNLFIAAGWTKDGAPAKDALLGLLHEWLGDHHPTAVARGYSLQVVHAGSLVLLARRPGRDFEKLGTYRFAEGKGIGGRFGAYTPFEFFGAEGNALFVDMESQSTGLGPISKDEETKDDRPDGDAERDTKPTLIDELIHAEDHAAYSKATNQLIAERLVEIVYLLPSTGLALVLARFGGTGLLESYPGAKPVRDRVHARNLEVAGNIKRAYESYLATYIRAVEAIDPDVAKAKREGKPHPEVQLHDLGPPDGSHAYPKPAGATPDEYQKILTTGSTGSLEAWKAISRKLDAIWGNHSEGSIWMVVEFAAETGQIAEGLFPKAEVKWNFELHESGELRRLGTTKTASLNAGHVGEKGGAMFTYEVDAKSGEGKGKVNLKLGKYGFDVDTEGTMKASYGPVYSEVNSITAEGGIGAELSLRDLVTGWYEKKGKIEEEPEWVKRLPDFKAKVGLHYRGLTQGTALSVVHRGHPGFFGKRPRTKFVSCDWTSLDPDERTHLDVLGWKPPRVEKGKVLPSMWDAKQLPDSAKGTWVELTAEQKIATLYLPIPVSDPEWGQFWGTTFMQARRKRPE